MKNLLHTVLSTALLTGALVGKTVYAQMLPTDGDSSSGSYVTDFTQIAKEGDGANNADWTSSQNSTSTVSDKYGKTITTTKTATVDGDKGMSGLSDGTSSSTSGSNASGANSESSGSNAGTSGASGSGAAAAGDSEKKDDDKKAETAENATKYTGVFNDRQILPNTMAMYCKTNAEDMVKDSKKLYDCINKIAQNLNDKDPAVRDENRLRYEEMRYEELKTLMSQAVAKGASISNYEKIQNEIGDASGKTQTEHEDNVAIANTLSTLTDVINSMRDLYAERLKNDAISGISSIDAKVIANMEKNKDENDNQNGGDGQVENGSASGKGTQVTDSTQVEVTESSPKVSDPVWKEGNNCTRTVCDANDTCNDETIPCPNGVYPTDGGYSMICTMGNCIKYDIDNLCTDESLPKINKTLVNAADGKCDYGDGKEVDCQDGIYSNNMACLNGSCMSCAAWEE